MSQRPPLALTDPEKLILVMLSDIQQHLKIKGEVDPAFVKDAIFSGNLWALGWRMPGIFDSRPAAEDVLSAVIDYLNMWERIEESYERLSDEDKTWLEAEASPFGKPRFTGFDGNHEGEYIGVARFLIEKMGRFSHFLKRDLNCHHPSIDAHQRMYQVFEPLLHSEILANDMTAQQLATVLKERMPPERRQSA